MRAWERYERQTRPGCPPRGPSSDVDDRCAEPQLEHGNFACTKNRDLQPGGGRDRRLTSTTTCLQLYGAMQDKRWSFCPLPSHLTWVHRTSGLGGAAQKLAVGDDEPIIGNM